MTNMRPVAGNQASAEERPRKRPKGLTMRLTLHKRSAAHLEAAERSYDEPFSFACREERRHSDHGVEGLMYE